MMLQKIVIEKKEIKKIAREKANGKKIILCHGAFDLVHPGHINHFQEAKSYGDILVVTITADKFIKKNIHSPFYNQEVRKNFLKNIKIIDYVFVINDPSALPAIEKLKPDIYCKGIEYKKTDNIGNLNREKKALLKNKGKLKFLGKNIQSSSKIISNKLFKLEDKKLLEFLKKINFSQLIKMIEKIKNLKVLVIGETIIDNYTYVKTSGVSPKSNTLSCIEIKNDYMPGGSLATYRFLSSFIKKISHVSIINDDKKNNFYSNIIKMSPDIIKSKNYKKLIKKRIVEGGINAPLNKILTLNEFNESDLSLSDENLILKKLKQKILSVDLVIAQDFGHGFFTKKIINLLQSKSKKLSINVQTNSLNYGFNIINRKYRKVDYFSLDERELQLFASQKELKYEKNLKDLTKKLSAKKGFLTCGGKFSLLFNGNKFLKVPVLNQKAIDTVGAGDIFHAMASIMSAVTKDDHLNLFISQVAGAHAVEIIGNSDFPKLSEILNTLKFYQSSLEN
jgi:cytidyltransferase-like protein